MTSLKETNKVLVTNSKEMEKWKAIIHLTTDVPDNELKIIILTKLNETQENKDRQLNKMRKTTHEQNYKVNKEIETPNKQTNKQKTPEILQPKNTTTELKNSTGRFNNTLDHAEESENTNAELLKLASYINKKRRE